MRKFLQNIYRKPKQVRENYALVTAGVFTMIVCVFWVTARLQTPIGGGSIVRDTTSPFATLIKKSKEQLATLKAAMPEAAVETEAEVSTSSSASTIILSEEDKAAAAAKATSTATSSVELQYKEVLIGTTSASTTQQ
jgi:hypothetical protein